MHIFGLTEQSLFTAGGGANKGWGNLSARKWSGRAKFQCKPLEGGGNISVHRDLKALLKPLENTLKIFAFATAADHIQYNTTTFANVPYVIGHFGNTHITTTSSEFTCKCLLARMGKGGGAKFQCRGSERRQILSACDFQICTTPPPAVNNDRSLKLTDFYEKLSDFQSVLDFDVCQPAFP